MTVTPDTQQIATSSGHTFVCYARYDEGFVMKLAAALRDRGVPIWIDQWSIEAGADWSRSIDAGLNACANFLIVLSPEAVASDEVRGELHVALNAHKHVIPVLHRPCEVPRQLLIRQRVDFTQSTEVSEASLDVLVRALRGERKGREVSPTSDRIARQTLLQDVRSEARERLRSTGTETPVPIQLERQPHQVARPWDDEVGVPVRQQPGPPVTDIVEVFDDPAVAGRLLILGAPGSGKTTVLLQLMQQLVARADQGDGRPIPVLISLASWKNDKPIDAWLVDELKVKYGVRADVGRRWRDDGRIAPLLDGLDELPAERQQACVEAVNDFQEAYRPVYLVVCCRRAEYENLAGKLRLQGAVCLLPLDTDQIRTYLDRTGCSDFWNAIQGDPELMEMARSPLLLSFMSALPGEPDAQRWQDAPSVPERRQRLFDAYVSSRASSATNRPTYSRDQTLRWLHRLATMLKEQGQAEFLIERMQPDWLQSSGQRWSYRAGVIVVSAAVVLLVVVSMQSLFEFVPRGNVGLALQKSGFAKLGEGSAFDRTTLLVIAIVVGCLIAFRRKIVPVETLTWSWSRAGRNTRQWAETAALAALDYGMPLSVAGSLIFAVSEFHRSEYAWQTTGEVVGTAGGVLVAIFLALIKPSAWLRQAQRPPMRRRVADALTAAVMCGLVSGWCVTWISGLVSAVSVFLIVGFSAAMNDRCRVWLLRTLFASVISGALIAALSRPALSVSVPLLAWLWLWTGGGLAVGMIASLAIGLTIRSRESWRLNDMSTPANTDRAWMRTAVMGLAIGVSLGLAVVVTVRMGGYQTVRGIGFLGWWAHAALLRSQAALLLGTIGVTAAAVGTGSVLAALAGALSGASGADVERRLVPNQGIRQSALNVVMFAALGILIVGLPYGLFNLSVGALFVRTLPTAADFMNLGVGAGATFGLLAGLLPGAACIQHFVLRLVLWASGTLPLRCASFLNFATRRRLLQRVGGRYRFIHVLLRDHLGGAVHARTAA
jgi:GTPase SAR1 family protein